MSTDTKIKTLIFNKLTQEQYNNADKVPTEFYLTPDTSIDSSEKGAADGVASLDTNGKVPSTQIPVATASSLGGVKPDGNTITVTEDGTISAAISGEAVATKAELQALDSSKADTNLGNIPSNYDYVVESKTPTADDPTWYRKYKSGWLEQGGIVTAAGEVTLLKPFANTAYSVQATSLYTNYTNWGFGINKTSVSSFHLNMNTGTQGAMWEAKGQGAE